MRSDIGLLIADGASDKTPPHEILHACGAKDIYWESSNHAIQLSAMAKESYQPNDWGRYRLSAGGEMPQSNIVQRLLMHGKSTVSKGDIPTGKVGGLQRIIVGGVATYLEGMCAVGLSALTNAPISH